MLTMPTHIFIFLERERYGFRVNVTNRSDGSGTRGGKNVERKAGLENGIIPIPLHTTYNGDLLAEELANLI